MVSNFLFIIMFLTRVIVTESIAFAKRIGLGAGKITIGGGRLGIGVWVRRRLAGQFRSRTPAGRRRSRVKFAG
jgi:hypothetical protein